MDIEANEYDTLVRMTPQLLSWYEAQKRDLPWRAHPSAYHVWVSEIMLQQTRVEAVKRYYARFIEALPDIPALAAAEETKLLKLWEGLGYYNRVRNMQRAAQRMMAQYGGRMPESFEEVLALPGIGSYTAGAVCSIAFGMPEPAVDGNVLRVISRVLGKDWDIAKPQVKAAVEDALRMCMRQTQALYEKDGAAALQAGTYNFAGAFNQALMELGALVCVPNGIAACESCPLRTSCQAHAGGRVLELPYKSAKKPRRIEERTVFLLLEQECVVLRKRPAKGLLAGLYEFPNTEGFLTKEQALLLVKNMGFSAVRIRQLPDAKHIFTHVEWHMRGFLVQLDETMEKPAGKWIYAQKEETAARYAIPSAFAAYRQYL